MARRLILVTRPEPGLGETMRLLAAMGFDALAAPLLTIECLRPAIPARVQAVLLTSGQAAAPLAAMAPALCRTPVLAVGDATARRALAAGFETVESAAGDAAQLATLAARRMDPASGPLLLACGLGQGRQLARRLRTEGFEVILRSVYAAHPVERLADQALDALTGGEVGAILFFSGETAATFAAILPPHLHAVLSRIDAYAVSAKAAEPLRLLGWRSVGIAASPTAAALLALLGGS